MGSGKTSCLDAICFAFFGSFPSLKSRQVSLLEVVMSRPTKKTNALVEVEFTANNKTYLVTRLVNPKGTEAFLRCEGALIEGPQPIRTTEAVSRILKVDYDVFTRVIYGEQNKLDYFLTLQRGQRKIQIDELLGISLFETVRQNCTSMISKLKVEKTSLENFLNSVNAPALETEITMLRSSLSIAINNKNELEKNLFVLTNEFELVKKNLESLEELKKINEELKMQLVTANAEANSLHTSAVSVMPASLASLTREQCTSLLEQCARALQERFDLEHQVTELSSSAQRFEGEAKALLNVIEQFPPEKLKTEIVDLSRISSEFQLALQEFIELGKKESAISVQLKNLESEIKQIEMELLKSRQLLLPVEEIKKNFASLEQLEEKISQCRQGVTQFERLVATKLEVAATLEKSLFLLQREYASCPTCDQAITSEKKESLIHQKTNALQNEKAEYAVAVEKLASFQRESIKFDSMRAKWVESLPIEAKITELQTKSNAVQTELTNAQQELEAVRTLSTVSKERVDALRVKADKLESTKQNLAQSEKSLEKLEGVRKEIAIFGNEIAKKQLALSSFEEKQKLELKLEETRSALKAFELFEKTELLHKKSKELTAKLSNLQFQEGELVTLRAAHSNLFSKLESIRTSLGHISTEAKEKTELVAKLDAQYGKLVQIKKNCSELDKGIHDSTIFQNSLLETQAELRSELISAVNQAMHEVWQNVYPYKDYSSCRVLPTEDDYALEVLSMDGWKPIEQCSGGEKTCAALSLRVSLAMILVPNLSWLVLDEPTHNLDAQGVNLLARALHDSLPTIVRQTFVVTHDEALKEGASGAVHFFNRNKDLGEATLVETLA